MRFVHWRMEIIRILSIKGHMTDNVGACMGIWYQQAHDNY